MSGSIPSSFGNASQNVLFDPLMARRQTALDTANQNALLEGQEKQQTINANDIAMTARAAAPLLDMSEEDAAKAYPGIIQELQARGGAKYAPSIYPGHAATQALVQRGLSVPEMYQYGAIIPPGLKAALQGNQPAPSGTGSGTPGGNAQPLTGDLETDRKIIAQRESGGDPTALNYVAHADPTAYGRGATASGKYQFVNSTWREGLQLAGLDPAQYPTAMSAPESVQDKVFTAVYGKYGTKPWDASTFGGAWVPAPGGGFVFVKGNAAPATATAAAPGGRPGGPGTYRGPGFGVPAIAGGPPAAPVAAPGGRPGGPGTYPGPGFGAPAIAATDPGAASGTVVASANPAFAPAVAPPSPPSPAVAGDVNAMMAGINQARATPRGGTQTAFNALQGGGMVASNAPPPAPPTEQPPGPPAAPSAAPGTAAAARANLPHYTDIPSGPSSAQRQEFQRIQDQITALVPYSALPAAKARIAQLQAQQQVLMQTDSVVQTQEGPYHPLTGVLDKPVAPLPNYQFDPNAGGPGIPGYVDTTGTNKPEINPARRGFVRADGSIVNDQGQVIAPPLSGARPPLGSYDQQVEDEREDRKLLPEIAAQGQSAQTAQVRLQTLLDLLPKISTGASGYTRTQLANLAETAGFPGIAQALIAHTSEGDASAAQEFGKLTLASAGAAERGDLGSRGSLGAIKLYQQNNPGLDLRPGANKAMLGMQLIAAQADTDYSQGALAWAQDNRTKFRSGKGDYSPLADFNLQWQQARNPQVYAAAMGALNGQDPSVWAKGLSRESKNGQPSEYDRALDIVSRASPNATVNTFEGRKVMQPNAQPTDRPPLSSFVR